MPFLIGAFGAICKSLDFKRLHRLAENDISSILTEDASIFTPKIDAWGQDPAIQLPNNYGVLIGKIFEKTSYQNGLFTLDITQKIVKDPQILTQEFWGRYAGVLYDQGNRSITLVRDPLGLSTLFYSIQPDGIVFSTEIALLYDLLENKPSIDWMYFAEYLIGQNQALPTTPFAGIQELLPGMSLCYTCAGNTSHRYLWNLDPMRGTYIENNEAFEEQLLAVMKKCTQAWTRGSKGVCVQLSGGTDSSGVTLLLRSVLSADQKLMCVNYIDSQITSSNEVEHAKEVANACHAPLSFLDWHESSFLDPFPDGWRPNRPSTLLLNYNGNQQLDELAASSGCDVIMNGQGGDHVFIASPPMDCLADLWLQRKFKEIPAFLSQLSGIYRTPWWSVIQHNLKSLSAYYRRKNSSQPQAAPFLDPALLERLPHRPFYLKEALASFHPGKAKQLESLYHAVAYSERSERSPSQTHTHPILSQPIVELALKIPIFQSFKDGYNRIFFRNAVSRIQKLDSLWRKTKRQTTTSTLRGFTSNFDAILDLVTSGSLYHSGILHKKWVEEQLVKIKHGLYENLWPLLYIITSQRWLNQWKL